MKTRSLADPCIALALLLLPLALSSCVGGYAKLPAGSVKLLGKSAQQEEVKTSLTSSFVFREKGAKSGGTVFNVTVYALDEESAKNINELLNSGLMESVFMNENRLIPAAIRPYVTDHSKRTVTGSSIFMGD